MPLYFSFEKHESGRAQAPTGTYDKLRDNPPIFSPYATWEIRIDKDYYHDITHLAKFAKFPIDIELHCTGKYIVDDVSICENKDMGKMYAQIGNW